MARHHKPYLQVDVILPKLLAFLADQGVPSMEVTDFHDENRASFAPDYNPPTMMVNDHWDGPYIVIKLARTPLPKPDSMRLIATHVAGYISLEIDFAGRKKRNSSGDVDDATIMKAFARPETKDSDKSYARYSLIFYREERNIGKGDFSQTVEIDLESGDLKLCEW